MKKIIIITLLIVQADYLYSQTGAELKLGNGFEFFHNPSVTSELDLSFGRKISPNYFYDGGILVNQLEFTSYINGIGGQILSKIGGATRFRIAHDKLSTVVPFEIITSGNSLNLKGTGSGTLITASKDLGATGIIADFSNNEANDNSDVLLAKTYGTGTAIHGVAVNNGVAGFFENQNAESVKAQLVTYNVGLGDAFSAQAAGLAGSAGRFENNSNNNASVIFANNYGSASALFLKNHSQSGENPVLIGFQDGLGAGIDISNINTSNYSPAIKAVNAGIGIAGSFQITNQTSKAPVIIADQYGLDNAGVFQILQNSNTESALLAYTNGTGNGLEVRHWGSSGNLAIFKNNANSVIRFDKTGKGFFNNGSQMGGADLAEAFEVEGARNSYEEGDVLAISLQSDRKVEKSNKPYSTLIAGVYATKPGVLLTEENIEASQESFVPMGVVGVIPTKVCDEGGKINRGDLIVSASKSGFAMKADPEKVKPGQILGKALENFVGKTGKIKILVNIQ